MGKSVWAALSLVCFLATASVAGVISTPTEPRNSFAVDLTLAQLTQRISDEAGDGRQLIDIEVRRAGSIVLYSAVFSMVGGTVHYEIRVDEAKWANFVTQMDALSGRWIDIEASDFGSSSNPLPRRSGIFLEGGEDYETLIGPDAGSDRDFQVLLEEQQSIGRQIVDFEAYFDAATLSTKYIGLWVNATGQPRTSLYYNLRQDELEDLLAPIHGRVLDLERYESTAHGGQVRYAMIVAPYGKDDAAVRLNNTLELFEDANGDLETDETRLIDLEVYLPGTDGVRLIGVWGDHPKSMREVEPYADNERAVPIPSEVMDLLTDPPSAYNETDSADIGMHAKNLRTRQTMRWRGEETFYLASTSKIAAHFRLWQLAEDDPALMNSTVQYTTGVQTPDLYFVDDRTNQRAVLGPLGAATPPLQYIGLSSCACNGNFPNPNNPPPNCFCAIPPGGSNPVCQIDLGQDIPLDRLDAAMMMFSDNAATSMLFDDPVVGLTFASDSDGMDLNEWLSMLDGVGRGFGVMNSIQDLDRLIAWQSQEAQLREDAPVPFEDYNPLFLAPPGSLQTELRRGGYETACRRQGPSTEWGPVVDGSRRSTLLTWLNSDTVPDRSRDGPDGDGVDGGVERYYNMGLNSAEPRAMTELVDLFVSNQFTEPETTRAALNVMNETSPLRFALPSHFRISTKGGSKGGMNQDPKAEVAIYTMVDPLGEIRSPDTIVIGLYAKNNTYPRFVDTDFVNPPSICNGGSPINANCASGPFATTNWVSIFRQIGQLVLPALTPDLVDNGEATRTFSPDVAVRDQMLSISTQILNAGGGDAPAYNVEFYASRTASITRSDTLLGTVRVEDHAGGTIEEVSLTAPLPFLFSGNYFIGWIIDPQETIDGARTMGEVGEFYELAADFPTMSPPALPGSVPTDYYNPFVASKRLTIAPVTRIRFEDQFITINEGAGRARFTVLRTGSSVGRVTVNYEASDRTAMVGLDYEPTAGTLVWEDGDMAPKTFDVLLVADGPGETREHVYLALSEITGFAVLGDEDDAILFIEDVAGPESFDAGDAPSPYPTLLGDFGAHHEGGGALRLGELWDEDRDGRPEIDALGDDLDADDDEDGVELTSPVFGGAMPGLEIIANGGGIVDAWLDFNADGDWADPGEQILDGVPVAAGTIHTSFAVPLDAVIGETYARFRLTSAGVSTPLDLAPDGEVEDYKIEIIESPLPLLGIQGSTREEGDTGRTPLPFTVTLSRASESAVEVRARTVTGGGADILDFDPIDQVVRFEPGDPLSQIIEVQIRGDTNFESDESFRVELSEAVGAVIVDSSGTGIIVNDDSADADEDGSDDKTENLAPNGGDGNNDGVPDREQSHVVSLPSATTRDIVTVAAPPDCPIFRAAAPELSTFPDDSDFPKPQGVVRFALRCSVADVRLFFYGVPPSTKLSQLVYRKYGPEPHLRAPHWYSHPATFSFPRRGPAALMVELRLVDGASGDHDLMSNGVIIDPGGVGLATDLGGACSTGATCASGHCVDGVCCTTACSGPGASCTLPGSVGSCRQPAPAPVLGRLGRLLALMVLLAVGWWRWQREGADRSF